MAQRADFPSDAAPEVPRRLRSYLALRRRRSSDFRRSRLISMMRVIFPVVAVGLLVLVATWPRLVPDDSRFRLEGTAVGPAGSKKPQVLNPRLLGVDNNERPFQISADMGSRVGGEDGEEVYQLDQPKADITLGDGSWVALTAKDGIYRRVDRVLQLSGNVSLFHDSGTEFVTETAHVDLARRSARGDERVEGQGPFGLLESEGFRILNEGDLIVFTGKTRLTLLRSDMRTGF